MYPAKKAKSDRERFLDAFRKQVGCEPSVFLHRRLEAGEDPQRLKVKYESVAADIARKTHAPMLPYDEACREKKSAGKTCVPQMQEGPCCPRCGGSLVMRTGQTGPRKGVKYWGCRNYPECRYTRNLEP